MYSSLYIYTKPSVLDQKVGESLFPPLSIPLFMRTARQRGRLGLKANARQTADVTGVPAMAPGLPAMAPKEELRRQSADVGRFLLLPGIRLFCGAGSGHAGDPAGSRWNRARAWSEGSMPCSTTCRWTGCL